MQKPCRNHWCFLLQQADFSVLKKVLRSILAIKEKCDTEAEVKGAQVQARLWNRRKDAVLY